MKSLTETVLEEPCLNLETYSYSVLYSSSFGSGGRSSFGNAGLELDGGMRISDSSTKNTLFIVEDLGGGFKLGYSYHDGGFGRCELSLKGYGKLFDIFKGE
ncbi:MAG: hypothetical protein PHO02_02825 [Candidatus Nanoarchaeia archaeon]|nr:hypothetical protein [Candidatus Nanoarchaeia archaeon]